MADTRFSDRKTSFVATKHFSKTKYKTLIDGLHCRNKRRCQKTTVNFGMTLNIFRMDFQLQLLNTPDPVFRNKRKKKMNE